MELDGWTFLLWVDAPRRSSAPAGAADVSLVWTVKVDDLSRPGWPASVDETLEDVRAGLAAWWKDAKRGARADRPATASDDEGLHGLSDAPGG